MPLTSSAKKALKQDRTRRAINDLTRHKIKSAMKAARLAIVAGDKDAKVKIDAAYRELDIAAKKNVVHKNKASRLKSRLAKKLAKSADAPKEEKVALPAVASRPAMQAGKKAPTKKTTAKKK